MSDRIIPLELVSSDDGSDGIAAFTDVVVVFYLEGLPQHDHDGDLFFDSGPLSEAAVAAFALGCAMGVDFPARIEQMLEQTHPNAVEHIIAECREPLEQQADAARRSTEPLEPEDFIDDLLKALEEAEHADIETAQNALSMSFEYGLVLAHIKRSAALVLRNAFNRAQEEAVRELDQDEPDEDDVPPGPTAPFESLQEFAAEIMAAYEADIGFSAA